jgi:hypothetical protein
VGGNAGHREHTSVAFSKAYDTVEPAITRELVPWPSAGVDCHHAFLAVLALEGRVPACHVGLAIQ